VHLLASSQQSHAGSLRALVLCGRLECVCSCAVSVSCALHAIVLSWSSPQHPGHIHTRVHAYTARSVCGGPFISFVASAPTLVQYLPPLRQSSLAGGCRGPTPRRRSRSAAAPLDAPHAADADAAARPQPQQPQPRREEPAAADAAQAAAAGVQSGAARRGQPGEARLRGTGNALGEPPGGDAALQWLPAEDDFGNVEYKLRLREPLPGHRFQQLVTQMQYRLSEGAGECFYYVGARARGAGPRGACRAVLCVRSGRGQGRAMASTLSQYAGARHPGKAARCTPCAAPLPGAGLPRVARWAGRQDAVRRRLGGQPARHARRRGGRRLPARPAARRARRVARGAARACGRGGLRRGAGADATGRARAGLRAAARDAPGRGRGRPRGPAHRRCAPWGGGGGCGAPACGPAADLASLFP